VKQTTFLLSRPLAPNVGIGPQCILGVLFEFGRHANFEVHEKVAPSSALQPWDAPLPYAVHSFGLGACRHHEVLGTAFEQRNLDIGTERGFGETDGNPVMQVVTDSMESVVRPHPDLNIYISRRRTTLTGAALLVET
jgi:hypothetical protein